MSSVASSVTVNPFVFPQSPGIKFGATVSNVDLEKLTDADFAVIRLALFTHQILVFKEQGHLTAENQYKLTRRFDPEAQGYSHGITPLEKQPKNILHPDLKTVPRQPQVQVIGNGFVEAYEGLSNIQLRHPHHRTFHATAVAPEDDERFTRFYRWHIDAALYGGLWPTVVTTLLAVQVPGGRRQVCRYDDGTGDELEVPLCGTAFVSGYDMYDRLSAADKALVRGGQVEYAPHPYVWMSGARSQPDGLGLLTEGRELPLKELPEINAGLVQMLPMCWRNPVTGLLALQVHPAAALRLHLAGGVVVEDLLEVRATLRRLQRPGIAPGLVYAHDWAAGDLVLFHNRGLLHSVVGALRDDEVRIMRQCGLAASHPPVGPEEGVTA